MEDSQDRIFKGSLHVVKIKSRKSIPNTLPVTVINKSLCG